MSTITADAFIPASNARPSSRIRRFFSLARAEVKLLSRAGTALATSLLMPPLTVMALLSLGMGDGLDGGAYTTMIVAMIAAWMLMLGVYYNLTAVYVARREERVFKRLTTGEATIGEVIGAAAFPPALVLAAQIGITLLVAGFAIGMPVFANPVLLVVALVLGAVVFSLLAAASTAFTPTVEAAQYSTMPALMVFIFLSGVTFPLQYTPEIVQTIASWTPLHAVCELVTLGLNGTTMQGEAAGSFMETFALGSTSLACLAVWAVAAMWLSGKFLRMEPRR